MVATKDRILIIGVNSFLGKNLSKIAIDQGYHVIGAYHRKLDGDVQAAEIIQIEAISSIYKKESIKTVFLISAHVPFDPALVDHMKLFEANIELTETICRTFPKAKIIFCSSVSVYEGLDFPSVINERTPVSAFKPYALSKLWGEHIVRNCDDYAIIRFSSIYGVGMNNTTFIPKIIDSALIKGTITLLGNGERLQNYIYVKDAANMLLALAQSSERGLFLGTSDESYSNIQVAHIVQKLTNSSISFTGADTSVSYRYSNRRVREVLGRYNFIPIEQGLEQVVIWKEKQY